MSRCGGDPRRVRISLSRGGVGPLGRPKTVIRSQTRNVLPRFTGLNAPPSASALAAVRASITTFTQFGIGAVGMPRRSRSPFTVVKSGAQSRGKLSGNDYPDRPGWRNIACGPSPLGLNVTGPDKPCWRRRELSRRTNRGESIRTIWLPSQSRRTRLRRLPFLPSIKGRLGPCGCQRPPRPQVAWFQHCSGLIDSKCRSLPAPPNGKYSRIDSSRAGAKWG